MRAWIVTGFFAVSGGLLFAACGGDDDGGRLSNIGGGAGDGGSSGDASASGGNGAIFGGGSGGGSGNPGTGGSDDGGCGTTTLGKTLRPVNILLVIDKSGSMTNPLAGSTTDKWTALNTAMTTVLNDAASRIDFGLDLYPLGGACNVPSDPALTVPIEDGVTGVPKILTALDGVTPSGGTPTAKALDRALDYFTTGPGAMLEGDKYVLLATDGGPNCTEDTSLTCDAAHCTLNIDGQCSFPMAPENCCDVSVNGQDSCIDDVLTTDKIDALLAAGIGTFVVGLPGTEDYATYLNAFAVAGGHPSDGATDYYAVDPDGGVAGLTAVFEAITTQLITSCRLQLTSDPPDVTKLNVSIDVINGGEFIPQGPDGWQLDTTTDPPTIELLGSTCTTVETTGAESVSIVYGCPTVMIR